MNGGSCDAVHDVVVHDPDAVVAPAEVLLADEALDGAVLEQRELHREGVPGDALERAGRGRGEELGHPGGVREQRPAADEEEAAQVRRGRELVLHQLLAQLGVVVAEQRGHVLEAVRGLVEHRPDGA